MLALAAAVSAGGVGLALRPSPAGAGQSGASYGVYVALGTGGYDTLALDNLAGGPTSANPSGGYTVKAVALTADARFAVLANNPPSSQVAAFPATATVVPVAGGAAQTVDVGDIGSVAAVATDPVNPNLAFVLGTGGAIDEVFVAAGAHEVGQITPTFDIAGAGITALSLAVTPGGQSLVGGFASPRGVRWGVFELGISGSPLTYWAQTTKLTATRVSVAVSPDGSRAYAAAYLRNGGAPTVALPLPLVTGGNTIWTSTAGAVTQPAGLTVTPNGGTLYAAGVDQPVGAVGGNGELQALSAASGAAGRTASIPGLAEDANAAGGPTGLALSPDAASVVVVGEDGAADSWAYPVATSSMAVGGAADLGPVASSASEPVAITPDQAPVAALSAAAGTAQKPVTLDAGGSSVAYGSIVGYRWDFGDGTSSQTSGPSVTHTWAAQGSYTVTLTETDGAGASVAPAPFVSSSVNGPGPTPYIDSNPSARTTAPVAIGAPGKPPPTIPTVTTTTTLPPGHAPVIALDPPVGAPGAVVTVTGHGWTPGKPVTVAWSPGSGTFTEVADANGNLAPQPLLILVPDLLGPRMAVATQAGKPVVHQPFLVVAASAEPGSGNSFLFRSEGP